MMSTATLLSRVTGFLRIWATALALGATGLMSAFSIANSIPNMIFELVAGGIVSALFIPSFMELRVADGEKSGWRFASHVFNLAVLVLGAIALIGTIWPEPFIWTQTFRLTSQQAAGVVPEATFFFRFFAIQVVIYGAGSVISGLLNAQRQYFWPAVGPIFNNVVAIATMLGFAFLRSSGHPDEGMVVLAGGTTIAVFVMFGVQIPALLKSGWRHTWGLGLRDPALRRMLVLAVPTVVYVVTNLVAVSFRNTSALAVSENGVAILTYAWVFYQLPYGILAVALATAIFTELAESAGKRDHTEFSVTFLRGLRFTGVLMLPTSALLIALATPLVSLYRVGAFKESDIPVVAGALRWWASGLIFYACTMFLLRTFYSLKDTRTPMLANLVLTAVQIGLYIALSTGIGAWSGLGINGIPIADAIFFLLSAITLAVLLRRRIGAYGLRGVTSTFARMLLASVIGAALAWGVAQALSSVTTGLLGSLVQVMTGGLAGLGVAFMLGRLLRVEEVALATSGIKRFARRLLKRGDS